MKNRENIEKRDNKSCNDSVELSVIWCQSCRIIQVRFILGSHKLWNSLKHKSSFEFWTRNNNWRVISFEFNPSHLSCVYK